jgi:NDP-sugar pyrophosphorylase family protein
MLAVAGRPILERVLLHLVGWGIRRIAISVNYLSHVIENHFGDGSAFGCEIRYLRERQALGTGGALSLLRPLPKLPVLVMNGDLVTQVSVGGLLAFHDAGRYAVTVGVRPYSHQIPFGVVEVRKGRVVALTEKPTQETLVNAGIYVLSPAALRLVPRGKPFPITGLVELCARKRLKVGARVIEEDWLDIGRDDDLRKAREGS